MKKSIFLLLLLLLGNFIYSQRLLPDDHFPKKVKRNHSCTQDHADFHTCVAYLSEAEIAELKKESKSMEVATMRNTPVPRAFRILMPYDEKLLVENGGQYDHETIVSMITENANRTTNGFNNSQIENRGLYLDIRPWTAPTYPSIHDYRNALADPDDGVFNYLYVMKNEILDMDHMIFFSLQSVNGKGVNTQISQDVAEVFPPFWTRNFGVVNFKEIELKSITLAHEIGHGLSADHDEGSNSSVSKSYARAFLKDIGNGGTHSIMKSGNILSAELDAFSGPNSYAPKKSNGELIHAYTDSTTNNALAVKTLLEYYWVHNTLLSAEIEGDVTCGSGTLNAVSDNADQFTWEVIEGNIDLSANSGSTIEYMAHTGGTIMLFATTELKGYSDISFVDVPAIITETRDTTIAIGGVLPDGNIVNEAGEYDVLITGNNEECDTVVTYNVSILTSTFSIDAEKFNVFPNPTYDIVKIDTDQIIKYIELTSSDGKTFGRYKNKVIDVSSLPNGIYYLLIVTNNGICAKSFSKE